MWNYRLVHHKHNDPNRVDYYAIHEVFCNNRGEPWGMTTEPIRVIVDDSEWWDEEPIKSPQESCVNILSMILRDVMKNPIFEVPKKWAEMNCDDEEENNGSGI